jgi:hypothetical protein
VSGKTNMLLRAVATCILIILLATSHAWCGSLPANDIVISGGEDASSAVLDSTDIFDPKTLSFSVGPTMAEARVFHAQVPLGGRFVLIAGGLKTSTILTDAELLDRTTGTFTPTGSMEPATLRQRSRCSTACMR